ncbi:CDP-glycerol glycerophosphotransferase family protein [Terrilactibacillus tamarindi]|uniref:CDP-glycerol glycerophosphotransferase family protein n=1 Tax=Terrilactibacillus tamarindi TaxID=2599694 RepID=UPI001E607599|nr:CDP-glycerol glycerophosphotransferase family protein [Terrilactibacillus tamarindi]
MNDKVTFVVSFGDNTRFVYEEMKRQQVKSKVVFLCKKKCISEFKTYSMPVIPIETFNLFNIIRSCYHLATSKLIFVDNYFGFLSVTEFKKEVTCIQLWHAAGAIKTFGLMDNSAKKRSKRAQLRFKHVYEKFDKIVIGSDTMGELFIRAFHSKDKKLLRKGIPRTDFFYDNKVLEHSKVKKKSLFNDKKVILYAPTFRENELDKTRIQIDLDLMEKKLSHNFVIILRLHPAVRSTLNLEKKYPDFVYDYSSCHDINYLLLLTDILITDYSSIPFEFSLLHRPMIFFPYDLEKYKSERGLWNEYNRLVPGPIVRNTDEIIELIQNNDFDIDRIKLFSKVWNKYSQGQSSEKIVEYLFSDKKRKISKG